MITGGRVTGFEGKKMKDGQHTGMSVSIGIDDLKVDGQKLVVTYTYTVDYQPDLAKLVVKGEVFMDEKNPQELVGKWKKSKEFPPSLAEDLLTGIGYAGSAVGTLMAFGLGISAPLTVSRAKLAQVEVPKKAS